ncbi:MAG: hypothetical protein K5770_12350 [Lachnospiraceae bacterium]|nr:hypothetical protein [Lachnospiraceae bacterium]
MKKKFYKIITASVVLTLMLSFTGCSGEAPAELTLTEKESVTPEADVSEEKSEEEVTETTETTEVANPWRDDVSVEEVADLIGAQFIVPDGAENVSYRIMESDKLAEMDFELDGLSFCARMKPAEEFEDISGLFYTWDVEEDQDIYDTPGQIRRAVTEEETVDSCLWYDEVLGMMFSVSTSAEDLDGFDIVAVAQAMYQPMDEGGVYSSFVEFETERNVFDSYEDLISCLKEGNGYAYIELEGYDGELLAIAEATFDDLEGHQASMEVYLYGDYDGEVVNIGNFFSYGTAYPIRCDGKLLYGGGNHEYESDFLNEDGTGLMVKDLISVDYDEQGNASYYGFLRDKNVFDEDKEIPEDPAEAEELFNELTEAAMEVPVIDFEVVE